MDYKIERQEGERNVPAIICDESLQRLPFRVEPNPAAFGKLAKRVGISDERIGQMRIHIEKMKLGDSNIAEFDYQTRELFIRISRRREGVEGLGSLLNRVAHELDHYQYYSEHPEELNQKLEQRTHLRQRSVWQSIFRNSLPGVIVGLSRLARAQGVYHISDAAENHARNMATQIEREAQEELERTGKFPYPLVTIQDKPKRSLRAVLPSRTTVSQ